MAFRIPRRPPLTSLRDIKGRQGADATAPPFLSRARLPRRGRARSLAAGTRSGPRLASWVLIRPTTCAGTRPIIAWPHWSCALSICVDVLSQSGSAARWVTPPSENSRRHRRRAATERGRALRKPYPFGYDARWESSRGTEAHGPRRGGWSRRLGAGVGGCAWERTLAQSFSAPARGLARGVQVALVEHRPARRRSSGWCASA
jgi:hypothetical protein